MEQEGLIANFCAVANCDSERAKFFLSAANWELETALNTFFLDPEGAVDQDEVREINPPEITPTQPPTLQEIAARGIQPPGANRQPQQQSRFGTMASISVDDDSSDDETNKHYAGGSEHSGQLIKSPPSTKVQDIFNSAKEHGAEVVENSGSEGQAPEKQVFGGSGFKLGSDAHTSEHVPGAVANGSRSEQQITITFWKNGFTVDDGTLRAMNDPANQEFLEAVMKGEIPQELVRLARGAEVHVNMVDNRTEDFLPPKPVHRPFSGSGHKLGSPVPEVISLSEPHRTPTNPPTTPSVDIDVSAPVTSIQIRLSDGTRLVSKFNHLHTIADIRNFINLSRPNSPTAYTLMTTFPNKALSLEQQTIADAGLLNACIVQRKC